MTDAPETTLWEELRTILRQGTQIFGAPAELLEDLFLPRREARLLRAWLSSLEAVARALLVLIASRLPRPAPLAAARAPASASPSAAPTPHDAPSHHTLTDDPTPGDAPFELPPSERWAGVTFRMTPCARRVRRDGEAAPLRSFLSVRALAYRLEALIRVAAAPLPFARRLARRLHAEPGLAGRVLRRPRSEPGRPPPFDELVEEALGLVRAMRPPPLETG